MPANSRIIPYDQTNTVIVTDTGSNIAKLARLLDILDVEGYDAGIEVIPVKFASAGELAKLIDTLVPGTPAAGPGQPAGRFGGQGGRFSARRTKEGGIINTIIADERTNTLIVHANSRGADQVRELVAKLDQKITVTSGGGKVHVIYLQFAEAEAMSTTLNNLSATAGQRSSAPTGGTGSNPVQSTLFEGAIKVAPDKSTNSLVVTASPSDFATMQRVINKLDIPRDQVFSEIVIMEVNMGRSFNFSANFINPSSGIALTPNTDLFEFLASPAAAKGATLGFSAGKTVDMKVGDKNISVSSVFGLIRAIQGNSKANILATPQILTLDNTEATFDTTENIPVPTVVANGTTTSSSVTKEKVSLSITLKPQINKMSNFVKLDINAKLEDINKRELPAAVQNLAFATISRNAKTSVVVADSDTVVLGGLTRDNVQETTSKVPILGDIPLLGWLFKSRSSEVSKSNLLIFITPKVIRQYENIRAVLDKKLKERDEFLEANSGGDDVHRPFRDQMIRGLPDLKELMNKKPETNFTLDQEEASPTAGPQPQTVEANPGMSRGKKNPATPAGTQPPSAGAVIPGAPQLPPGSAAPNPNVGAVGFPEGYVPPPPPAFDPPAPQQGSQ
jgi:general secretion pathway protein D